MEEVKSNRLFAVLVFVAFLKSRVCDGDNTIFANQSLTGDQTIESPGGVFVLGFFKPGRSSNNYIGMWYKVTPTTVVWVANREKPVSDRFSSQLKISDGNLVLLDEKRVPIWSTNVNSTSTTARAVLNDNGNLVLSDGSETLWQSFDNPADTWLPGAKISYNNVTKTRQRLTSWKNKEDPSPGLYTLELNPANDSYIILWNETKEYWNSGPWNGEIFSLVPEMRRNYIYDFEFVVTSTERYFTYTVYNNSPIKISRFMIDVSGQVKQTNWLGTAWSLFWSQPRQQCEVYSFCGAYGSCAEKSLPFCQCLHGFDQRDPDSWRIGDFSDGCARRTRIGCGASGGEPDGFLELPSVSLPENERRPSAAAESKSECRSSCLSDCTCTGFSFEDGVCSVWTGDLLNLQQLAEDGGNGKTLFVRLAASDIVKRGKNKAVVVGAAVGSTVALLLALTAVVLLLWRRKRRMVGRGKVEGSLVAFRYRDLQNATKNFSEKLGGGGFGSVFKGALSDSTAVAVKKLESVSQGEKQFRTEVATIGAVQHLNLVRLRGFCSEGTHKLLVYDYMPNGSLDSRLFSAGANLDWKTRYQIALGTARGLHYLHEKCRDCIIHCDIKPENILLDHNLFPKVADFGLAKLVGRDFSRVLTTMRGTRGYLAPEWIAGVAITAKADAYSYGMMLFEVVSGRRNSDQSEESGRVKFFPTWAAGVVAEGRGGDVLGLLDPRLGGNANVEEVERVCRVACWCVQDEESKRPTMSQVVQILEGVAEVNVPPVPRSLQVFGDPCENVMFFTDGLSSSSSQTSNARSNVSAASSFATSTT